MPSQQTAERHAIDKDELDDQPLHGWPFYHVARDKHAGLRV